MARDDCPSECQCKTCEFASKAPSIMNDCGFCANCHNHDGYRLKIKRVGTEPPTKCRTYIAIKKKKETELAFLKGCKVQL